MKGDLHRAAKVQEAGAVVVVPSWVEACVAAGMLLPTSDYEAQLSLESYSKVRRKGKTYEPISTTHLDSSDRCFSSSQLDCPPFPNKKPRGCLEPPNTDDTAGSSPVITLGLSGQAQIYIFTLD
jgi:hypothetical protein